MLKRLLYRLFYLLPLWMRMRITGKIELLYQDAGYGDTFLVAAVCRELKKKYPYISVTVNRTKAEILYKNPHIDHISNRFRGIDLNYHFNGDGTSWNFKKNILDHMCEKVGIPYPEHRVDIFLSEEEMMYGLKTCSLYKQPRITIQASSSSFDSGRKAWPQRYWEQLIKKLSAMNCTIIQLGDKNDIYLSGALHYIGTQDIRRTIAIIACSNLHIGIVSSLMYGASAVHTPACILYGGFERYILHDLPGVYPIESLCECSPCITANTRIPPCPNSVICMQHITPDLVFKNVVNLIN